MKKILPILAVLAFGIVEARAEVAELRSSYSSAFYLMLLATLVVIGLVAFLMWKQRHGWKQVLRAVWISALITVLTEVIIFLVGIPLKLWMVWCSIGSKCPSQFDMFFVYAPYTTAGIFLVTLLIFCLVAYSNKKKAT